MARTGIDDRQGAGGGRAAGRWLLWLLCLAMLTAVPGCGGCRKDPLQAQKEKEKKEAEERAKKEKAKPKPDFEFKAFRTCPCGSQGAGGGQEAKQPYKPGHWTSVYLDGAKANNFDFVGELELTALEGKRNRPIPLPALPFELGSTREVALPKGQPKLFESALFLPPAGGQPSIRFQLNARRGGHRVFESTTAGPLDAMPSYQYHFVVLARWPDRYRYVESLHSVKPPGGFAEGSKPYYRLSLMPGDKRATLPSYALFWTGIACVLWDDAELRCLDLQQQQALVDWLHWGGQVIVSGPDTLDRLRDGFLAPYLPATSGGTRDLDGQDFEALNRWCRRSDRRLVPSGTWTGVSLQLHPQAHFLPGTGNLVAERRVGRGRVVVSAFRLSGSDLARWPAWDNFFNACLLRRGPRAYHADSEGGVRMQWADDFEGVYRLDAARAQRTDDPFRKDQASDGLAVLDAARVCNLRYFTRDTSVDLAGYGADAVALRQRPDETQPPPGTGVAAWNDFNAVAQQARTSLLEAARIEIPDRSFVIWMVVGYLLVLVPGNWVVFRLLGRIEWAWAAAPIIAVVSTAVVIRQAQLDIGFVRARTEVAVVELQGDYPRAHVTRYTALYTSLTTRYDCRFEDPGAVAAPFPDVRSPEDFRMPFGMRFSRLYYRRGNQPSLEEYPVDSNSTKLVHSEQMLDLGGPLVLRRNNDGGYELHNQTRLRLRGVGVISKDRAGQWQTAWVGQLEPQAKAPLIWSWRPEMGTDGRLWQAQRDAEAITAPVARQGELNLCGLVQVAENVKQIAPGEVRLIGWLDEELPGMSVQPSPPQARQAAVVVARLGYGFGPDPRSDTNAPPDAATVRPKEPFPEEPNPFAEKPAMKSP